MWHTMEPLSCMAGAGTPGMRTAATLHAWFSSKLWLEQPAGPCGQCERSALCLCEPGKVMSPRGSITCVGGGVNPGMRVYGTSQAPWGMATVAIMDVHVRECT
jgi:hypothetical protein